MGKANGSRECAPDDRLRVPTITSDVPDGGHGAKRAFAHPANLLHGATSTVIATRWLAMTGACQAAPVTSAAEPLDHIRERDMADASAGSRSNVSVLQGRRIDDGGVGLDAAAQGGEFWPA